MFLILIRVGEEKSSTLIFFIRIKKIKMDTKIIGDNISLLIINIVKP